MKKVLFLFAVITAMVFASCEKEDQPQLLSDFIVGGVWVYEQIEVLQTITFTGEFFSNDTYDLIVSNGDTTMIFDGGYGINDDTNVLTLDEPDFEGDDVGEPDKAVFNVAWTEGVEQMVWTQVGTTEENVLSWTR